VKCPYCGEVDSRVVDSRPTSEGRAIRRRRACACCDGRFTTYERVESVPLMVIKKDGRREEFDRQKILRGLLTACEKRPVALATLENLVDQVETTLRNRMEQEISSRSVGELVMQGLREIDEVAYVRFASVYRQFGDIQRFMNELQKLLHHSQPDEDSR
jgi:transcriptional repressor NrdR